MSKAKIWWTIAFAIWAFIALSAYQRHSECEAGGGCFNITKDQLTGIVKQVLADRDACQRTDK